MKRTSRIVVALALLAAGYGLGRIPLPDEQKRLSSQAPAEPAEAAASPQDAEYLAALKSALDEPGLLERTLRSAELLRSRLSPANAKSAFALYKRERVAQPILDLLIDTWGRFDGQTAFDSITAEGEFRSNEAMPVLLEGWATLDPEAARRAFETIQRKDAPRMGPAAARGNAALAGLVRGWARSEEAGLIEFLSLQHEGSSLINLVSLVLGLQLERDGISSLLGWADDFSSDDFELSFKRLVMGRVADAVAAVDTPRAASWAAKYAETDLASSALRAVSRKWVVRDAPAAMQWLASLPSGRARDGAVDGAYQLWLGKNREAAMAGAANASADPAWQPAVRRYAVALADSDPFSAIAVAEGISDDRLRIKGLLDVARIWYESDPGPATAWLEESELDETQRSQIYDPEDSSGRRRAERRRRRAGEKKEDDASHPDIQLPGVNRR